MSRTTYHNPTSMAEQREFVLDEPYDPKDKLVHVLGTCKCGTRGTVSWDNLRTGKFCRNPKCEYYSSRKKFQPAEMKEIITERGCQVVDIIGETGTAEIVLICVCGMEQTLTWRYFYKNRDWCSYYKCERYHKHRQLTTETLRSWFEAEDYKVPDDFHYRGKYGDYENQEFELRCPLGHLFQCSVHKWIQGTRCKICEGDGRTHSYTLIKAFYEGYGCKLLVSPEEYKANTVIPYECKNGHIITNLTKNTFNSRINQGLGPCIDCHKRKSPDRKEPRRESKDEWLSTDFKNKYRYVQDGESHRYVEVQLQRDLVMKCEIEHLPIVKECHWYAFKGTGKTVYYAKRKAPTGVTTLFHRIVYPELKEIDHINHDGLDNRQSNIREGSGRVNQINKRMQKNNQSGFKGVYRENGDKPRWVAQWVDTDGKRKKKSFGIKLHGEEKAKELATQYRDRRQKETETHLQMTQESEAEEIVIEEIEEEFKGTKKVCWDLLLRTYAPNDIVTNVTQRPKITYLHPIQKVQSHFNGDFYVPKDRMMVVIRNTSNYCFNWDINMAKFQACVSSGYTLRVYVFKGKVLNNMLEYYPDSVILDSLVRNLLGSREEGDSD